MLWHAVSVDVEGLADTKQQELTALMEGLGTIPDVVWFRCGRDAAASTSLAFIAVLEDLKGLARYRVHPSHVAFATAIRAAGKRAQRIDLEGLPLPA